MLPQEKNGEESLPPISARGFGIQTKLAHSLMFIIDQDCVRVCNSFPVSHL